MSIYTSSLGLEEITPGSQAGLWGNTTNNNLILIDQAVTGVTPLSFAGVSGTTITLDGAVGTVNTARSAVLNITGSATGANTVVIPNVQKTYLVRNNTGQSVTFQTAAPGDVYAVLSGNSILIFCDGNNNVYTGIVSPSAGTLGVSGGGTGATSFTAGFIKSSGGSSALTSSAAVNMASDVTGTLPVANGGTGQNTLPSGSLLVGNGTGTVAGISPTSYSGYVLTSNGSYWYPALPTTSAVSSVFGRTGAVTAVSTDYSSYYAPLSGTASGLTAGAVTNGMYTNVANTMSGATAGIAVTGATSAGDQRLSVSGAGYGSGLAPAALQIAAGGYGVTYSASGFDGYPNIGFIAGTGGGSFSISNSPAPNLQLYAGAFNCYKGGSSTSWIIYSDSRIKKNVVPYAKGLSELNQIQIKNFEFNGLGNTVDGKKGLGVIADEIEKILPDSITTLPTKLRPEDAEKVDLKTFDNTELIYLLVNSVQELSAEVERLKAKVGA